MSGQCRVCVCCLELTKARAEVERLRAEVAGLRDSGRETFVRTLQGCLAEAEAERDRLRAVLEPTAENLGALAMCTISFSRLDVDRILASLRARAGQP